MTPTECLKMLKSKIDTAGLNKCNYVIETSDIEAINEALVIADVSESYLVKCDEESKNTARGATDVYTVLCAGREYSTKFKEGDRVIGNGSGYCGVMVIEEVDEFLTRALNKLHWKVSSEDYLLGKRKVNNAEPVSDDEIESCT